VTKAGGVSKAIVESVDIYPTLCALAGLNPPAKLDGASFVANLRDAAAQGEAAAIHVYPRGERLGRAIRTERYRLVEWKKPGDTAEEAELELYDYETDPSETRNLATDQPGVVAELRALLATHPEAKPQVKSGEQPQRSNRAQRRRARQAR
jgi:iduronate 2-sulfatase